MQDPTEETEKPDTAENVSPNENTDVETNPTETAEETAPEKELDPWETLELEAAKWKDQAIRSAAELENFRKRMAREKLDAVRYGNQGLLEELLPVLDNFDMGMMAAEKEEGSMLYIGMNMVRKQIGDFFTSQRVEEIPVVAGGDFDPNLHEAIDQEASDTVEAGKIIRVVRKGYRIGERLLRPSNVIISQEADTSEEASTETESE